MKLKSWEKEEMELRSARRPRIRVNLIENKRVLEEPPEETSPSSLEKSKQTKDG